MSDTERTAIETKEAPPQAPVPDKFQGKSRDDVIASYLALEQKLGTQQSAPPAPPPSAPQAPPAATSAPSKRIGAADLAPFVDEYNQGQGLSTESYAKLEGMGFDKDIVDTFIAGQVASAKAFDAQVYGAIGGEAEFNKVIEWAKSNLSPGEIEAANKLLGTDLETAKIAAMGLHARMQAGAQVQINATPPKGPVGVKPFASHRDMTEAMKDHRYGENDEYTAEVRARVAASHQQGKF